jgi:hypothetical protein
MVLINRNETVRHMIENLLGGAHKYPVDPRESFVDEIKFYLVHFVIDLCIVIDVMAICGVSQVSGYFTEIINKLNRGIS